MNYSTNYSMREPVPGEKVKVADINYNTEIIDGVMLDNRQISIDMYDSTSTYNTDDLAGHENSSGRIAVYRCLADNTTGTWDSTKWVQTNLADEITDIRGNAGATTLDDLNDVEITNPTEGQALLYDDTNDEWVNSDLPDADVTKTASGNPIEFEDGADAPLVKCTTAIQGYQDLHGYDKPWVGGAGKNKLPYPYYNTTKTESGVTYTDNGDGTINVNGTRSGGNEYGFICFGTSTAFLLKAGSYILSGCPNGGSAGTYSLYIADGVSLSLNDYGNGVTFTIEVDTYIRCYIWTHDGNTYNNLLFKPMIRPWGTPADFAPYSNICPITAYNQSTISVEDENEVVQQTSTATFSQSIYQGNADFVGGTASGKKKLLVFNGSEEWTTRSVSVGALYELPINVEGLSGSEFAIESISNMYVNATNLTNSGTFRLLKSSNTVAMLTIHDDSVGSLANFKTFLSTNNLQLVYTLTNETTEQVTPTNPPLKSLFGYNHIESSTGEMEIEYFPAKEQPLIDLIPEASNMHEYSTAEHAVGTWIDGETIYEQTYTYSGTGAANPFQTTIDMTGKNLIEVIPHYARYTYNSGQGYGECVGSELFYSNSNVLNIHYVDSIPYTLTVSSYLGSTNSYDIAFTLRYTKTASNNRSLAKSAPQEETKEEPTEDIKEEVKEEVKEEPEEPVEEIKEVKEEETKEEGEINER